MSDSNRAVLERHLLTNGGDANNLARALSKAPKYMRKMFRAKHRQSSTSPTMWGKPNGKLDKYQRAALLAEFCADNAAALRDLDCDPIVATMLGKLTTDDTPAPAPEPTPAPEPAPAPAAEQPVQRSVEVDPQFAAVHSALGIQQAVAAALEAEREALTARIRSDLQIVRYEVHDAGKVRVVDGLKHECFEHTLDIMTAGQSPWLYGPSGTGKTSLAAQLAAALGVRYAGISASPGMSSAEFDGWLLPIGEHGRFEHVESVCLDFMANGGLFLIDEIANLPADVAAKLNMLLANGETWISKRFDNPHLKVHKDFYLVAADNTAGRGGDRRFVRQQQDSALRNRFTFVRVGYDAAMERQLFGDDRPWLERVWALRTKAAQVKLVEEVGLRQIKQGYLMRKTHGADKYPVERCLDMITAGWSDDDRAKVGVAA